MIEDYWKKRHYEGGYELLYTPHIGREWLWQTSGHLDFYKESMYSPMDIDEHELLPQADELPVPHHDLQVEPALLPRPARCAGPSWGRSTATSAAARCTACCACAASPRTTPTSSALPNRSTTRSCARSISRSTCCASFGFSEFKIELSVRDPQITGKYAGSDDMWVEAEASLVKALTVRGLAYQRMEGEAVFYGPKIDIKIKDALGRFWQCTTIQFDFNMSERFAMKYIGADGAAHQPYMVHRALLGSLERFFGVLIEHYRGFFPLWLAPVQAAHRPAQRRVPALRRGVLERLRANGMRVELDTRNEAISRKIRDAENQNPLHHHRRRRGAETETSPSAFTRKATKARSTLRRFIRPNQKNYRGKKRNV